MRLGIAFLAQGITLIMMKTNDTDRMTDKKFEDTYGRQTSEKPISFPEQEKEKMHKTSKTRNELFQIGRWIFLVMLVVAGLIVGGTFLVVALAITVFAMIMSALVRLLGPRPPRGSIRRRH